MLQHEKEKENTCHMCTEENKEKHILILSVTQTQTFHQMALLSQADKHGEFSSEQKHKHINKRENLHLNTF